MGTSYEDFKNRAAGIQSYMVCVAIAVGGAWAVFQFLAVGLPEARKQIFAQAQINIKVDAREERISSGDSLVVAVVGMTNGGGRNVFLDYTAADVASLTKISIADGETVRDPKPVPSGTWGTRVLRSGETDELRFVVPTWGAGLYEFEFHVPLPQTELDEHNRVLKELGRPDLAKSESVFWHGSAIVNVKDEAAARNVPPR